MDLWITNRYLRTFHGQSMDDPKRKEEGIETFAFFVICSTFFMSGKLWGMSGSSRVNQRQFFNKMLEDIFDIVATCVWPIRESLETI